MELESDERLDEDVVPVAPEAPAQVTTLPAPAGPAPTVEAPRAPLPFQNSFEAPHVRVRLSSRLVVSLLAQYASH